MKARVFLSYARSDGATACDFFQKALQNAGYLVWRDIDMSGGAPWRQKVDEAIRDVDVVLLFLTPGANASENVKDEWKTAIRFGKRIVPLIVSTTEVPEELRNIYNYRDIREQTVFRLEPSKLQKDLEDERTELRNGFEQSRAQIEASMVDANRRKYLDPFLDHLRLAISTEPVAFPPEVVRMLFSLLSKLLAALVAGQDITQLVESMTAGAYTVPGWNEEPIYKIRADIVAQVLKKVRDVLPSISVPVIVVAMTGAEAADLDGGSAFAGLPPEWQQEFERIRPDLAAGWQQRYAAVSNDWEPFPGKGTIASLIRDEFQEIGRECQIALRPSFVEIRELPVKQSRQLLRKLRDGSCLVVLDAVSAWHPQLQAAFRASNLDVSQNSLVVRVSPHQSLDDVRERVSFLLREWLNCEFFQRADVDLDDSCQTVTQFKDLQKWMRNRLREVAPDRATQKSDLRPLINNFGS